MTKLTLRRRLYHAAQHVRHELHAVTDAEHRNAELEDRRVASWCAVVTYAGWATGQDDPDRASLGDLADWGLKRQDFSVHLQLTQASSNELRVLGAEIQH